MPTLVCMYTCSFLIVGEGECPIALFGSEKGV